MPKQENEGRERALSVAVPTIVSNRFYVEHADGRVRIAFAEHFEGIEDPRYRTAIVLSDENAFQLAELIFGILMPDRDGGTKDNGSEK